MPKFEVTNQRRNGRVVHGIGGEARIAPGQTRIVEMSEAEAKNSVVPGVTVKPVGEKKSPTDGKPAGDGKPVEIPADWADLHHSTRMKLAREISGGDVDDADAADAIITAELEKRAA